MAHTSRGTILLAEDEPSLRRAFGKVLGRAGYTVLEARDGAEAVATFQGDPERVDLLVTDARMPKMNGAELAAALWARRPELPILVMSGFETEDLLADFPRAGPGLLEICSKPLDLATLLELVEERIGRDASAGRADDGGEAPCPDETAR